MITIEAYRDGWALKRQRPDSEPEHVAGPFATQAEAQEWVKMRESEGRKGWQERLVGSPWFPVTRRSMVAR
jgi:hypothetical protein